MHDLSFQRLRELLHSLPEGELLDIQRAFDFALQAHAHQTREDGSPYALHVIAVAETLACWHADRDTIIAALLHDVLEDTSIAREEIATHFGRRVVLLVESVTKFSQADLSPDLPLDRKVETLRKLFDVMRHDMRSILIKLADRLHNVRTIDALQDPARRRRFARETLDVYHKIALHLGMRNIRHVFAEHCVPAAYDDGLAALAERDRGEEDARPIAAQVMRDLAQNDTGVRIVRVDVQPRNLLTFYERRAAGSGIVLPSDAFIISVQVPTEDDCYRALRLLHTLYRPVSNQFRDYIAAPSDAGYQSLHTMVTLPDGRAAEMRIRTAEMEEQAMQGITLWLFRGQRVPPNFAWLRRSEELDLRTRESSSAFWEALQSDVLSETISVTVDRRRLSIPKGSTVLDAAYAAHGPRAGFIRSASIGIVHQPLSFLLTEDDDIHCVFDPREQVTFDWLQMVSTQHARMCIVEVLKTTNRSDKQSLGATLLQKELDHYGRGLLADLSRHQCQNVARHFRRSNFQDVLALIGEGVLRSRDVVFFLYPDRHAPDRSTKVDRRRYPFRVRLTATLQQGQEILSLLHGVVRMSDVTAQQIFTRLRHRTGMMDITIIGSAEDRLAYADFVDLLERQEWVSRVEALLSRRQRLLLIFSAALATSVLIADILFFPYYEALFHESPIPQVIVQLLPLLPIIITNYYVLRLFRHYFVRMRNDRWFVGFGFCLNIISILLIIWKTSYLHLFPSIGFVVTFFSFVMLFLAYKNAHAFLELEPESCRASPAQPSDSAEHRRRIVGYILRFGAVVIWGIEPVLIRYTPIQDLPPLLRVHLWAVAGAAAGFFVMIVYNILRPKHPISYRARYQWYFWLIVGSNLCYNYFLHKSLLFTTATKVNIMLSFAPIFSLIIAFLIWRHRISYLRSARGVQQMLIVFGISALGGTLLFYDNLETQSSLSLIGDSLALLIALSDVAFMLSSIYYVKYLHRGQHSLALPTHHFLWIAVFTFFMMFLHNILDDSPSFHYAMTVTQLLTIFAVGVLTLLGLVLTIEAFKRVDGLLAFLMLNFAPFIAFLVEFFVFHGQPLTFTFIAGGIMIVTASLAAEYIHRRYQVTST